MLDKLKAKGMREDMVQVFAAWLAEKKSNRAVLRHAKGSSTIEGHDLPKCNMGPWLWNLFYEDARLALLVYKFQETILADAL